MENDELTAKIDQIAAQLNAITTQTRQAQAILYYEDPLQRPSLQKMQTYAWVNSQEPIAWPTWPPGLKAKVTALLKKVMRRSLQWYIDPIVQQQNQYNNATLHAVTELAKEVSAIQLHQLSDK